MKAQGPNPRVGPASGRPRPQNGAGAVKSPASERGSAASKPRRSRDQLSKDLKAAQRAQLLSENEPVARLLSGVPALQRLGLNTELLFLRGHWNHIAGDALARHTVPWSLKDGVLAVRADSPLYLQELTYAAPRILRIAQDHLGERTITSIKAGRP